MPAQLIDQDAAKRIESGASAIVLKAKCVNMLGSMDKPCYMGCKDYEHRFKPGDNIFFHLGMGHRDWCKNPKKAMKSGCNYLEGNAKCNFDMECLEQGAKLVHKSKVLKSYPVRFEDLTEEIAEKCEFEYKYTFRDFPYEGRYYVSYSELEKLEDFLTEKYNAKDGDIFQVVEFEVKQ